MSVIAAALKHMLDANMPRDAIIAAVAEMEAAAEPMRSNRQERNARYYAARRLKASEQDATKTDKTDQDAAKTVQDEPPQAPSCARVVLLSLPSEEVVSKITPIDPQPSAGPSTAPRKASRAKPRSALSPDAEMGPEHYRIAAKHGHSPEQTRSEWLKFRPHHVAKGSLMANWLAAWETWCVRSAEYAKQRAGPSSGGRSILSRIAMQDYFDEPVSDHHDDRQAAYAPNAGQRGSSGPVSQRAGADAGGTVVDLRPTRAGWG